MAPLEDLEQDYPIIDSNFRMFCASHGIFSDEDFLVHDLYALEGFAGQGYAPEKLKQGIKQVFSIMENQHQPWLNGLELLDDARLNKCTLSTGCERIDVLLQGGLRKGHLTELVGPSSSCKTQVCLKSAAHVARNYLGKVIYFDTGNSFSPKRVVQFLGLSSDPSTAEAEGDISPYSRGRESTVWGVSLMIGYLGCDGFTSTYQDKLFKGYDMDIHNQIFYTTLCCCMLSFTGLILQGNLFLAIDFVSRHNDCFIDIVILSTVATISQFFISYTIRNFGALAFATIMTTRQLVSILLSCVWFAHPLSAEQLIGAVIVFGSIYSKSYFRSKPKPLPSEQTEGRAMSPTRSTA